MRTYRALMLAGAAGCLFVVLLGLAQGQQVHRNGFEAKEPVWAKGAADAEFRESAHDMTDKTAHTGQFAEHIQLTTERGNFIYYTYATARAPIGEELSISLWLKANRPGIQLMARLVLPKERSANNLDEPLTTLIRGEAYQLVGRWQRLELSRPVKAVKDHAVMLRSLMGKDVDFTDAYIDQVVLNLYGGPGLTEAWIDDLEVGPVVDAKPFATTGRTKDKSIEDKPVALPRVQSRAAVVEMNRDHLLVSSKRFMIRGIRHSDTPLKTLRDAGFNTLWVDCTASANLTEEAANLGFWLIPTVPATGTDPQIESVDGLHRLVSRFADGDAVLGWDLGGGLTAESANQIARVAQVIRAADPQRPIAGDIWDGFRPYSRHLDLLGIHRWPLLTGLELAQYREWLNQRRLLARPGTYTWTWVQTHLPEWYTKLVFDRPGAGGFQEPVGPQPEQIRLLTYLALAAGARGIGFWSDRFLADSHQGRDRLLALALLNQELQMLEPLLLSLTEPPIWIDTSIPEVKAAVLRCEKGLLVLPIWLGRGSQFVPGQSAATQLTMVVPQAPKGTQAWELSPAGLRSLQAQRETEGMKVTLPEFGLTGAVLFTADNGPTGVLAKLQEHARRTRKLAAQWSHSLAETEMEKVLKVEDLLEKTGHMPADAQSLRDAAQRRLRQCVEEWNKGNYQEAYLESQRALRPLRILMRAQWESAVRDLDVPVASPYAVSFFTLPRHWTFWEQILQSTAGPNVLPQGDFEQQPDPATPTWAPQETTLDDVDLVIQRVTDGPQEGKHCLKLEVRPKNLKTADGRPALPPAALERTFLAVNSPAVSLSPGSLVRISGWIRVPQPIAASADGALLFDSIGGEPLAVRLTGKMNWKKFTLYRQVPADGKVSVTLALTGIGSVYFDDLRIEPLLTKGMARR